MIVEGYFEIEAAFAAVAGFVSSQISRNLK